MIKSKTNKIRINVYLNPTQLKDLKKHAQIKDVSYALLIREAIRKYLEVLNR
jgi:predicted DNA binding CopG/RHH family protein